LDAVYDSDATFDKFMISRKREFSPDRALVEALANVSDTCFVEYSLESEILELLQFPQQPEFFHHITSNVFRARKMNHGRDDNTDVCVCHKAIPSDWLSQWLKLEQSPHLSEERVDSVAEHTWENKRRSSQRLRPAPQSLAFSAFSAVADSMSLSSSSSSSSANFSVAPETDDFSASASATASSAANDLFQQCTISSSAAMRLACCGSGSCLNRSCMTECPLTCRLGQLCENSRFQRRQNAEVEARPTFDKGWGLFACAPVEADTFMIEYCGEVIENDECERRIQEALRHGQIEAITATVASTNVYS
jgi:hypothetical protein